MMRRSRSTTTVVFLTLCATACASWQPQTLSPRQVIQEQEPYRVRLVLTDGSRLILRNPALSGESILGTTEQAVPGGPAQLGAPALVALSSVSGIELREGGTSGGTILIVVGTTLVAICGLLFFAYSTCDGCQ